MFQHATGTSKTCGFQSLGYRIFSQTAVTTVTQCLCGSLPTLRSRGVPTISSVFFQHTGSGTDFFRECGVRCCCPAPSSIEAEASPQPPGLVPSPAHSQGHRAHFEGVCHQYHFPRLDLLPFYCPGPVRPPLPPPAGDGRYGLTRVPPECALSPKTSKDLLYKYNRRAPPYPHPFPRPERLCWQADDRPQADPKPHRLLPGSRPSSRVRSHTQRTPPFSPASFDICTPRQCARLCACPMHKAAGTGTT